MDELKKLLENAGVSEGTKISEEKLATEISIMLWNYAAGGRTGYSPYAVDHIMEQVRAQLLQWQLKHTGGTAPDTFTTDDGREEPVSGRMSDDDNYGVGGLIDQGR